MGSISVPYRSRIVWALAAGKYGDIWLRLMFLSFAPTACFCYIKMRWLNWRHTKETRLAQWLFSLLWGSLWPSSGSRQLLLQYSYCPMPWQFVVTAVLFSLSLFDLGLWSQMLAEGCNPTEKTFQGSVWCSLRCSSPKTANTDSSSQKPQQP